MNNIKSFFVFLCITVSHLAIGQNKNLTNENVFSRYLVSGDESIAKMLINSKDNLYSLFCQGDLTKDLDAKVRLFTQFIQQKPKLGLAKAYLNRGMAYTMIEKNDLALLDYNKSIELDSNTMYAYYFRGTSYFSLENYDKAIDDYTKAIEIQPDFYLASYMRGMCFLSQKTYKSALFDFNKAIELNKKSDKAYLRACLKIFNLKTRCVRC
jgi:tetratricopeptide (TPR) repeat protein